MELEKTDCQRYLGHMVRFQPRLPKGRKKTRFLRDVATALQNLGCGGAPAIQKAVSRTWRNDNVPGVRTFSNYLQDSPDEPESERFVVNEPRPRWEQYALPHNVGFLLRMESVNRAVYGHDSLWKHEAEWATKLEGALTDLGAIGALALVQEYAWRERASIANTADLDLLLAGRPWTTPNEYSIALTPVFGNLPHISSTIIYVDSPGFHEKYSDLYTPASNVHGEQIRMTVSIDALPNQAPIMLTERGKRIHSILACRELGLPFGYVTQVGAFFPEEYPDGPPGLQTVSWEEANRIHPPDTYPSNWIELTRWLLEGDNRGEYTGFEFTPPA